MSGSCQKVKDFTEFSLQLYRRKITVCVFAWSFLGAELLFVSPGVFLTSVFMPVPSAFLSKI